jgi:hypothetical protein
MKVVRLGDLVLVVILSIAVDVVTSLDADPRRHSVLAV